MNRTPTMLLVDDSENDLLLLETAFQKAEFNCQLQKVYDGAEAIAYLQGEAGYSDRAKFPLPTGVLLDLNMPRKTGFDVLSWARARTNLRRIPFIVLTASLRAEDVLQAFDLGANSFLVKPASLHELVALLQRLAAWLQVNHFPPRSEWVKR